jgi:hypothetical protein
MLLILHIQQAALSKAHPSCWHHEPPDRAGQLLTHSRQKQTTTAKNVVGEPYNLQLGPTVGNERTSVLAECYYGVLLREKVEMASNGLS